MSELVAVTGATGNVASKTVALLRQAGVRVRAIVHDTSKGAPLAALGAEIVAADMGSPRTLGHIFDGVDRAFLLTPNGPRAPQWASSLLWAARKSGVKKIVRMSAVGAAHDAPTVNSRLHALSDTELSVSGLEYTILKPHFFMENLFMAAQSVAAQDKMYLALGEGRLGMVATADIAGVAAHVLTTSGHAGKTYTPTGPKSVSIAEVAEAFSAALGRKITYVPVPVSAAEEAMAGFGMDDYMQTMMADYFTAYAANWGDFATDDVPRLLGRPATSIAQFAAAVAPAFGKR